MTIEIIGTDESIAKTVTCKVCGSIIRYYPMDIKIEENHDYYGDPGGKEYIECPKCNREVIFRAW